MGWYEAIKDGISLAQKADNLPLVQNLIDAQKQIMDLQNENNNLREKNLRLKEIEDISSRIERHEDAYITISGEEPKLIYCSCCWDTKKLLVQGNITSTGKYHCPSCGCDNYFNRKAYNKGQADALSSFYGSQKSRWLN